MRSICKSSCATCHPLHTIAMVLVEIPLWVSHGNPTADKKRSILPTAADVATATNENEATKIAKAAISLLPSKKQQRPPMYGVDIHPDGTRFATASGDGTVKIWSTASLFGGRFDMSSKTDKERSGWSKFTENGNYISSNSEGEGYDTCSSVEKSIELAKTASPVKPQNVPVQGVNDLSGLVRKKKGVANASGVKNVSAGSNAAASKLSTESVDPAQNELGTNNNELSSTQPQAPSQPINNIPTAPTKQPKLLTTISSSHTGSILSLRFSPSGQYLSTAGDDSYINIYTKSNTPSFKGNLVGVDSAGNRVENNEDVEHWKRIAVGRGHALDVVGLAWAPDDSHLVSCSLDSVHPVIVWRLFDVLENDNADTNGVNITQSTTIHNLHPFKILGRNVHTSTVKGVAFDPAGKFIATSGDDPAICIWRAFDDWGLEARIDSTSGVFRSKKRKRKAATEGENDEEDDPGELASLSLFRRISFAPDGSHVCGTNASIKGRHIAAMITRDDWAVSVPDAEGKTAPGAANLVGHKMPVVASRHCPIFFQVPRWSHDDESSMESDDNAEPEYATLVALGDKKGFVTVWSTKLPKPLFKMQCSESRCTVTDISWGFKKAKDCKEGKDSLVMIVSLLDGYVVAINFNIPEEAGGGNILSSEKIRQIFRSKHGIPDFVGMYGDSPEKRRGVKRLVDASAPILVENPLQLAMEMENETEENGNGAQEAATPKDAKKRGRPAASNNVFDDDGTKKQRKNNAAAQDPLQNALDAAARADSVTARASGREKTSAGASSTTQTSTNATTPAPAVRQSAPSAAGPVVRIPHITNKIFSVDLVSKTTLAMARGLDESQSKIVADCVNSPVTPGALPFATLTISRGGVREWKDILARVACTYLAANHDLLAVGTADGCLYLYGTSPTLGWGSAKAFRCFPPFVLGCAVVDINFSACGDESKMVVVTSDGSFYVYKLSSSLGPQLEYKGSIAAPMQHISLSYAPHANENTTSSSQSRLARIQITDSSQLMLVLSFGTLTSAKTLHGFVYNRDMELWMRVSDSNSFLVSDFYSSIPGMPSESKQGLLSKMERIVRSGASTESAKQMYIRLVDSEKQTSQKIVTRAHCEDRLACAIALGSASEFQTWLSSYARCLSSTGDAGALRFLVDVLLGSSDDSQLTHSCWWLNSISDQLLGLDNKDVIRCNILPEMSKNRELQRLMNEISMELDS